MFYTILFLLITASALTFILFYVFRNPGPWKSFWVFMTILFLAMFAFVLWVPPIGPVWYDIAWLDTMLFGLVLALLLGAAGEGRDRDFPRTKKGEVDLVAAAKSEPGSTLLSGIFLRIFFLIMILIIISGLWRLFQKH